MCLVFTGSSLTNFSDIMEKSAQSNHMAVRTHIHPPIFKEKTPHYFETIPIIKYFSFRHIRHFRHIFLLL